MSSVQRQAELIRTSFPHVRDAVVAAADKALAGLQILPGTGGGYHFTGNPIKWCDLSVGDPEYVWGLNRMYQWPTLGRASLLTGDLRYAERLIEEWVDWIEKCPPPVYEANRQEAIFGCHPWRQLELGLRNFQSWPQAWDCLAALGLLTGELAGRIAKSMHQQGAVLFEYSPQVWPEADHNHFLTEMLGLLSIASRFPEFPESARWQRESIRHLERCMDNQMTAEGGQVEGCPHYHDICVNHLLEALIIARKGGLSFPPRFIEGLRRGVHYALQATRPTGLVVPWGDSDADHLCVEVGLKAYEALEDPNPLRVLAPLVGHETLMRRCEMALWDIDDFEILRDAVLQPPDQLPPLFEWHRELQQATARSGWDRNALSVFFACRTPVNNGHGHIDPGSFDFTALGRELVVDPGRYTIASTMIGTNSSAAVITARC